MIGSLAILCPAAAFTTDPLSASAPTNDALGAAVAFAFMGMCSLVFAITRATAARRTFATSRRKVAAERALLVAVARRQRGRALAFVAACIGAAFAVVTLPVALDIRLALSVTPALMAIIGLVSAWRLQTLLGASDVDVTAHGEFFYAARGARLVGWVSATPRLIARAMALPIARLQT